MSATTTTPLRSRRAARRSWWVDGLEAAVYLVSAAAVAFVIAGGGFLITQPIDWLYGIGRSAGVVATVFLLTQVLLASRAPYIERAIGHDRAMALHTRLGKWAIILMIVHAALIVGVSAVYDGRSPIDQTVTYFTQSWYLATAQIGLAVFLLILALSLAIVRRKWRYEAWHAVHYLVYVAAALVVPHQFLFGSTFVSKGLAWWFWLALYVFAFGSLIVFRFLRPLVVMRRHGLRVTQVSPLPDGSTSVIMEGRELHRLKAAPGQFFLWRFLAPGFRTEVHPFSLSRGPDATSLRITVKPSGDFSSRIGQLPVGTRVLVEGPLGVFSDVTRTQPGVVLVAAGIGVTPIRAMLDAVDPSEGPVDVIIRCSTEAEAPLLDEVRELVAARGATVHVVAGSRGTGWSSAATPATLKTLVPDVAQRDVYVCGPRAWAMAVEDDALAAGCPKRSVHREEFAW
jgi:predicted ferric reductase